MRDALRHDISSANSAFNNGEWKGSTVIAGSVAEALLLWSIQECTNTGEFNEIVESHKCKDLNAWSLHDLIDAALELKLIKDNTANQCRIAKDFRNLIHPGREIRLKLKCSRGTALSALAAIEHIITELTEHFTPP